MAHKIIFVIVEGPSESEALDVLFDRRFAENDVRVEIIGGDLTSDYMVDSTNIVKYVTEKVQSRMRMLGKALRKNDIGQVLHIVDTDGAFVPDTSVVEDLSPQKRPVYSPTVIHSSPKSNIRSRNRKKKTNLYKLSTTSKIWKTVPYSVYFMSCNLDHVLYDKQNNERECKTADARAFARRYKDDLPGFSAFINHPSIAVEGDYKETWRFIQEGVHSLERHTNLGLCFPVNDDVSPAT